MTFSIYNFGCKVNQYESQVMADLMIKNGYTLSENKEDAHIMIINSCTVTSVSDNKVMKLIRHLRRKNPDSIIVLTGCMPQAYPTMSEEFLQADIVLGNSKRAELPETVSSFLSDRKHIVNIHKYTKNSDFEITSVSNFEERTRAFVKIEDGCNRYCSYCIIPYARGPVRSKPLSVLKSEIANLASHGYKEIVLVGINLSAYGQDIGTHLCGAVDAVCNIDGIERVRLGSLEPERMDNDSISRLSKQDKFCPQFHLSLQSGCAETLKRMNRHYTPDEYEQIVNNLRTAFNNCSITTDVMVGFAGESEDEFSQSLEFVERIGFAKVHVFPYSQREGTTAAKRTDQVRNEIKAERSRIMIEACEHSRQAFLNSQIGRTEQVILEQLDSNGYWKGYTKNYTPVKLQYSDGKSGNIETVHIVRACEDYVVGEYIDKFCQ